MRARPSVRLARHGSQASAQDGVETVCRVRVGEVGELGAYLEVAALVGGVATLAAHVRARRAPRPALRWLVRVRRVQPVMVLLM